LHVSGDGEEADADAFRGDLVKSEMKVIDVIPKTFHSLFPFQYFNKVQSTVFERVFKTDDNVVVAAPTASGKTVIAELAILRTLVNQRDNTDKKVVYIAPHRALSYEKDMEWKEKFSPLGHNVYITTGEYEIDPRKALDAHIIISTPEKIDSATRKFKSATYEFVNHVRLVVVDEIHLLDSPDRGGALEVLITRLRRINRGVRMVALSATMKNIEDVALWLDATDSGTFIFDNSYRPVKLEAHVHSLPSRNIHYRKRWRRGNKSQKIRESYKLVLPHIDAGGQALVFVTSRKGTVDTAEKLLELFSESGKSFLTKTQISLLEERAQTLSNRTLKSCFVNGIAFHHAGLPRDDRAVVEATFRDRLIKVLTSTTTLAWGVNLPARVVVIQDTMVYDPLKGMMELSPLDLLQMLGRAGRPQFDDLGYGWIIADKGKAEYYRKVLEGKKIESRLTETIGEHLNAEISLGFIRNNDDAKDWIKNTFLYAFSKHDDEKIIDIMNTVDETIEWLRKSGFITEYKNKDGFYSTLLGRLTSVFYLRLQTGKLFYDSIKFQEYLEGEELLVLISNAAEFNDMVVRKNERKYFKELIDIHAEHECVDELEEHQEKIFGVMLASLKGASIAEELQTDARVIRQNASRLLAALERFYHALTKSRMMCERVKKLRVLLDQNISEEQSELIQVRGIGAKYAGVLGKANVTTLKDLLGLDVKKLCWLGIREGDAKKINKAVAEMPVITARWNVQQEMKINQVQDAVFTLQNWNMPVRVTVELLLNKKRLLTQQLFLQEGGEWKFPIGIKSPKIQTIVCEASVSFEDFDALPVSDRKVIKVTGSRSRNVDRSESKEEHVKTSLKVKKAKVVENKTATTKKIGECNLCGNDLIRDKNNIVCVFCRMTYEIPRTARLLSIRCERCGLPQINWTYLYNIVTCINPRCEDPFEIIKEKFDGCGFLCPDCAKPLVLSEIRNVSCSACKTSFKLPMYVRVRGDRCFCGLPILEHKDTIRCLNPSCNYNGVEKRTEAIKI